MSVASISASCSVCNILVVRNAQTVHGKWCDHMIMIKC